MPACTSAPRVYRARDSQSTPLYRLVELFYEDVKGCWEECFERMYGRWRGFLTYPRGREPHSGQGRVRLGFAFTSALPHPPPATVGLMGSLWGSEGAPRSCWPSKTVLASLVSSTSLVTEDSCRDPRKAIHYP